MIADGPALLRYYKESAGLPGASLCLAIGRPTVALLRPVATHPERINAPDVELLTKWRNQFVTSFLTEFHATAQQTRGWLTNVVGPDDTRILFMVDDPAGRTFGYMGVAFIDWERHYVEADAIVRGGDAPPGTMRACLKGLLGWAANHLGLSDIHVRVRSDNPAVEFYRKLGFREEKRVGLKKIVEPGKTVWLEEEGSAPVQLVYMTFDSSY